MAESTKVTMKRAKRKGWRSSLNASNQAAFSPPAWAGLGGV